VPANRRGDGCAGFEMRGGEIKGTVRQTSFELKAGEGSPGAATFGRMKRRSWVCKNVTGKIKRAPGSVVSMKKPDTHHVVMKHPTTTTSGRVRPIIVREGVKDIRGILPDYGGTLDIIKRGQGIIADETKEKEVGRYEKTPARPPWLGLKGKSLERDVGA